MKKLQSYSPPTNQEKSRPLQPLRQMNRVNQNGEIHCRSKQTEGSPFNRSASLRNIANEGSLSGTIDQSFSIRGYSANKERI